MKKLLLMPALIIAAMFIFFACKKGLQDEMPTVTSNSTAVTEAPPLTCCVNSFAEINPLLYNCSDLQISITNDATHIIVDVVRTGERNQDAFSQVAIGIVGSTETHVRNSNDFIKDNDGHRTSAQVKISLTAGFSCDDPYRIGVRVVGLGGIDFTGCNNDASSEDRGGGVLYKEYDYKVKSLCITEGCSMSQGYFFAKPQSVWVGGTVTVGGVTYTKEQGSAIFKLSCNTAGKLGFQQVATLKLSVAKGSLSGIPTELVAHVATIENFLTGKNLSAANACSKTFENKAVQQAAGAIGDWIDMEGHHCSE